VEEVKNSKRVIFRQGAQKNHLFIGNEPAKLYVHHFATCCNPVQGDEIFAFLGGGGAFKIHRISCQNATNLMANYGHRVRKAEWGAPTGASFIADLRITGVDGKGVVERMSHRLSTDLNLSMRKFALDTNDSGSFEGIISVVVQHRDQLELAIRVLKSLPDISTVTRIDSED
jgi:GTP diphosphokinase / guanosine-3',5'-bis(diphosphate) 3'-diphosphatase